MARALFGALAVTVALPLSVGDAGDAQVAFDLVDLPFSIDESLLSELTQHEDAESSPVKELELIRKKLRSNLTRADASEADASQLPHRGHHPQLRGAESGGDKRGPVQKYPRAPNGFRPLVWLHLHKAGGTLMCKLAERNEEHVVRPATNCNWQGHDGWIHSGNPYVRKSCAERAQMFQEFGFTYGQIEREMDEVEICDKFRYGVMFREPLELMQSVVNFELWFQTEVEHTAYRQPFLQFPSDVTEWMKSKIDAEEVPGSERIPWTWLDNFQTRVLANAFDVPAGQINGTHLTRARAFLRKHDFMIQVLEDLPSQGQKLFDQLGWTWSEGALTSRINSLHEMHHGKAMRTAEQRSFTPKEKEYLRRLNQQDVELYNAYSSATSESRANAAEPRAKPAEPQAKPAEAAEPQAQVTASAAPPLRIVHHTKHRPREHLLNR